MDWFLYDSDLHHERVKVQREIEPVEAGFCKMFLFVNLWIENGISMINLFFFIPIWFLTFLSHQFWLLLLLRVFCSADLCDESVSSSLLQLQCHLCETNPASLKICVAISFSGFTLDMLSPLVIRSPRYKPSIVYFKVTALARKLI